MPGRPVGVVEGERAVADLRVGVLGQGIGNAFEVVAGWCTVDGTQHAAVGRGCLVDVVAHEVGREAGLPLFREVHLGHAPHRVAGEAGRGNHAVLLGGADAKRVVTLLEPLADVERGVEGDTRAEEVADVVIHARGYPGILTGLRQLGHIVEPPGIRGVVVVERRGHVAAIGRVVGQVADAGPPAHRRGGVEAQPLLRIAVIALCPLLLHLRAARHRLGAEVGGEGDVRAPDRESPSAFGGDDHHAVRGPDAVEGCGRLPLQHVDALDVVGVDVDGAVGNVGTAHALSGREVGCRLNGHAVDHIERCVVAGERAGAANDNLRRGTRHTARRDNLHARQLALQGIGEPGGTRLVQVAPLQVLGGIAQSLAVALHAQGGNHHLVDFVVGIFEHDVHAVGDGHLAGRHADVGDCHLAGRGGYP